MISAFEPEVVIILNKVFTHSAFVPKIRKQLIEQMSDTHFMLIERNTQYFDVTIHIALHNALQTHSCH